MSKYKTDLITCRKNCNRCDLKSLCAYAVKNMSLTGEACHNKFVTTPSVYVKI